MFYQGFHLNSSDYLKKEVNENFNFPLHLHQCFEMIVINSGEMEIQIEDKNYLLKTNEAVMIFPGQIHSLKSVKSKHTLLIFSQNLVSAYYSKVVNKKPVNSKFSIDGYLIDEIDSIQNNSDILQKKGLLYYLCHQFDKNCEYTQSGSKELLTQIFEFINNNYYSDCRLDKLSSAIGYNPSYISRYFKAKVGLSYNKYIGIYRINQFCHLIENSNDSILTSAINCGFDSIRTFNRKFKDYYGITPSEYINNLKTNDLNS